MNDPPGIPRRDVLAAVAHLKEELEHAATIRDVGGPTRDGVLYALASVQEFLLALRWHDALPPITLLALALAGLDEGKNSPLLTPIKHANRPPDSNMQQRFRGRCVWETKRLMDLGAKREEACRLVAGAVTEGGLDLGSAEGRTASQVIGQWLAEKSRMSDEAKIQYDATASLYPKPLTLEEHKAAMRIGLLNTIRAIGTGELSGL